jgi:YHS domain-containing protein
MLRVALLLIVFIFVARVFWRIVDGFMEGVTGRTRPQTRVPQQGVQMVRDPVCGTFVLPERALTLVDGRTRVFFCSDVCRDKYRARSGSGRPEPVEGRTA